MKQTKSAKRPPSIEKILAQALAYYENGLPQEVILRTFPEQEKEIAELFVIVTALEGAGSDLVPPRDVLAAVLSERGGAAVTQSSGDRYTSSSAESLRAEQGGEEMKFQWNALLPYGLGVALLVVLAVGARFTLREPARPGDTGTTTHQAATQPGVSKDEDIAALVAVAAQEEVVAIDEDDQETAIDAETAAMSALGTAINEEEDF